MKKILTFALATLLSGFTLVASAAHEPSDLYEGTCQSSGLYHTDKQPFEKRADNQQYLVLQLWGSCGDEPSYLEIDTVKSLLDYQKAKYPQAVEVHDVEFWESPKKKDSVGYWKSAFRKVYYTDAFGKVIKEEKPERDFTKVIEVDIKEVGSFVIREKVSAKIGSPLFDSALGPISCQRGSEQEGLLERGYMDFQQSQKRK